jgi:hypothetical protein
MVSPRLSGRKNDETYITDYIMELSLETAPVLAFVMALGIEKRLPDAQSTDLHKNC